jgi:hypothetical protein
MQDHRIRSAVTCQYRPNLRHILSVILRLLDDGTDPRLRYHLACAYEIAPGEDKLASRPGAAPGYPHYVRFGSAVRYWIGPELLGGGGGDTAA